MNLEFKKINNKKCFVIIRFKKFTRMRLRDDQHLHELDGVGSNAVVVGVQQVQDDILDGLHREERK